MASFFCVPTRPKTSPNRRFQQVSWVFLGQIGIVRICAMTCKNSVLPALLRIKPFSRELFRRKAEEAVYTAHAKGEHLGKPKCSP